jgi:hypothetical protein
MAMKRIRTVLNGAILALSLTFSPAGAQQPQAAGPPQVGPGHGSLVVVGGNMHDPAIYRRFIELAGGPDAPIVMIPTAGGGEEYDEFYEGLIPWRENGARNLIVLHTLDRKVADSEAFVAPLRTATACSSSVAGSGAWWTPTPARARRRRSATCWSAAG